MKKFVAGFLFIFALAGLARANTILVEENTFPAKGHFAFYSLLQTSLYTRSYGPNYTIMNTSGYDFQIKNELYFGWQENLVLRLVIPYYLSGNTSRIDRLASQGGLFDMGLKVQYLFHEETDNSPSASVLAAVRVPSQDSQQGIGEPFGRLGLVAVLEKKIRNFNTYYNLGFVYTMPYTDTSVAPSRNIDAGDRVQFNFGLEYPVTGQFNLLYEFISEFSGMDMVDGSIDADSAKTAISHLIGFNRPLGGNSYFFAGMQVPLLVRQSSGSTGIVPQFGIYYEF